MRFTKKSVAVTALVGAAALTLASCSSDDGGSDEATDEPTTEETGEEMEEGGGLPETLTLALVPSDEQEQITTDGEALAASLSAELGVEVEVFVPESYSAVVVALQTGQADIGFLGPIAMVQAEDEAGAEIVLQSVRFGSSEYVGQWFTNDPGTYCLDDVTTEADEDGINYSYCNGATGGTGPAGEDALALLTADSSIAFVDASSASGYYFPATQLGGILGLDDPSTDFTNVDWVGGHPQAVQAVYDGDFEVGISYNDARTSLADEFPDVGEQVVVFAYTSNIPNDGVVVSGDLSDEAKTMITDGLLAIAETEDGAAALAAVYEIDGLEPANIDAFNNTVRPVEESFGEE